MLHQVKGTLVKPRSKNPIEEIRLRRDMVKLLPQKHFPRLVFGIKNGIKVTINEPRHVGWKSASPFHK